MLPEPNLDQTKSQIQADSFRIQIDAVSKHPQRGSGVSGDQPIERFSLDADGFQDPGFPGPLLGFEPHIFTQRKLAVVTAIGLDQGATQQVMRLPVVRIQ